MVIPVLACDECVKISLRKKRPQSYAELLKVSKTIHAYMHSCESGGPDWYLSIVLTGLGKIAVISLITVRFSNRENFLKSQDLFYLLNSRKQNARKLLIP